MHARDRCGLLITLVALSCTPSHRVVSTSELAGVYSRHHPVFVFHGSEPVEVEVADRLTLSAVDDDILAFELEVFAPDGKQCRMEGFSSRQRGRFTYRDVRADRVCVLWIEVDVDRVTVTDVESRCGASHCGGSLTIGRLALTRSTGSG